MLLDFLMGVDGGTKIFENFRLLLFPYILDQESHTRTDARPQRAPRRQSPSLLVPIFCHLRVPVDFSIYGDILLIVRTFRTDEGQVCPKHVLISHLLLFARGALLHYTG